MKNNYCGPRLWISTGTFLYLRGHLATSADILICYNLEAIATGIQ